MAVVTPHEEDKLQSNDNKSNETRKLIIYKSFPTLVEIDKKEWDLLKDTVNAEPLPTKWYTRFTAGAYSVAGTAGASLIPYFIKFITFAGKINDKWENIKNDLFTIITTIVIIGIAIVLAQICKHATKDKTMFEIKSTENIVSFVNMMDSKIVISSTESTE